MLTPSVIAFDVADPRFEPLTAKPGTTFEEFRPFLMRQIVRAMFPQTGGTMERITERWDGGPHPALCVNEGDRETVMESSDGERYRVPAGCGLLMTVDGPKVVRPGQTIVVGYRGGKGEE